MCSALTKGVIDIGIARCPMLRSSRLRVQQSYSECVFFINSFNYNIILGRDGTTIYTRDERVPNKEAEVTAAAAAAD